jgi:hypothetical protein
MRVDEARDDRAPLVDAAAAELRRRPDRDDAAVLHEDCAVADRLPVHGQHPVGGEDHSEVADAARAARPLRWSSSTASQIEAS